jgi:type II secretory pathway pseudopilin PulG
MSKNSHLAEDAYGILKAMRGGKNARGFTIVETLIVLAISAGLFVAIAATLSGRQNRTQFEQSIQEIKSQIQQVINDVGSGFYPDTNNFKCAAGGSGPILTSGASTQGENTGCVFLGKVMQFGVATTNPEQFRVYTLAGLQKNAAGDEVTTYAESLPKVIAPSTSSPSTPDASETKKLLYGLTTLSMNYGSGPTDIGAVAFVNSLAQYSSGSIVSGAQQVQVVPVNNTALNKTATEGAQLINANFTTSPVDVSGGVKLCFVSGGTSQSGLITIGNNNRQLSVTLSIKENKTCT